MERLSEIAKESSKLIIGSAIALSTPLIIDYLSKDQKEALFYRAVHNIALIGTVILMGSAVFTVSKNLIGKRETPFSNTQETLDPAALHKFLLTARPDHETCTLLMKAAFAGDQGKICSLQREGFFLDEKDHTGKTALHWAAIGQKQEAIERLWFFGCNCNHLDSDQRSFFQFIKKETPLYRWCEKLAKMKNRFDLERPLYLFYPPENLVFQGGGAKGIAYVGAQYYLERHRLLREVRRVAGTSAGAIHAMLVALGYSASELKEILGKTDLKDFLDHSYQTEQKLAAGIHSIVNDQASIRECLDTAQRAFDWWNSSEKQDHLKNLIGVYQTGGMCKGEAFLTWIEKLISDKTAINCCTFGEYKKILADRQFKHIFFYATQITPEPKIVCFNSEEKQWESVIIADAIRASISIPLVFTPHTLRIKTEDGEIRSAPELGTFVDGGIIKNLPINQFDFKKYGATNSPATDLFENRQTLAFNLVDPLNEKKSSQNKASTQHALVETEVSSLNVLFSSEKLLLQENASYRNRLVSIDNEGISLLSGFFITMEEKEKLISSAERATKKFFIEQKKAAQENREHDPSQLSLFLQERPTLLSSDDDPDSEAALSKKNKTVMQKDVHSFQRRERDLFRNSPFTWFDSQEEPYYSDMAGSFSSDEAAQHARVDQFDTLLLTHRRGVLKK
ncbi:MAG: hypothetical protein A3G30_02025 [Chlamydiae bacterium RIFCSPLOWO2_12_FULL_49_12]|nr:MAG: hypothetical protein A3G30_02025 [Chlamydiae bacterium RIFCSPLOWO2_12_FULL_49_12]